MTPTPDGRPRPVVIGVDSSTQSTKAAVTDAATGAPLAPGRAPHATLLS
ncbi:hypothetical protein AB0N09_34200 [Streptomyces erythrochromogenes]